MAYYALLFRAECKKKRKEKRETKIMLFGSMFFFLQLDPVKTNIEICQLAKRVHKFTLETLGIALRWVALSGLRSIQTILW